MRQILLVLSVMVGITGTLQAGLIYEIRFTPATTSVLPGVQTIDIFLDQTATGSSPANLHTVGLSIANFTVNSSDPSISFTGTTGFVDGHPIFAFMDGSTPGTAGFVQVRPTDGAPASVETGTLAPSGSPSFSTIRIGTIRFNLGLGQTTTLTATPDFFADTNQISNIAQASLTITAVPEPTSLALVGLAGLSAALWRRRK